MLAVLLALTLAPKATAAPEVPPGAPANLRGPDAPAAPAEPDPAVAAPEPAVAAPEPAFAAPEPAVAPAPHAVTCDHRTELADPGEYGITPYECEEADVSTKSAGFSSAAMLVAQGTADFISKRAQQEIVQWFVDSMAKSLCKKAGSWFPRTCKLQEGLKKHVVPSRSVIVAALKSDARTAITKLFEQIDPDAGPAFAAVSLGLFEHVAAGDRPLEFLAGISSVTKLKQECPGVDPAAPAKEDPARPSDGSKIACALIVTGEVTKAYLAAGGSIGRDFKKPKLADFKARLEASAELVAALDYLKPGASSTIPARELLGKMTAQVKGLRAVLQNIKSHQTMGIEPKVAAAYARQLATWASETISGVTEPLQLESKIELPAYWEPGIAALSAFSAKDYGAGFRATLELVAALPKDVIESLPRPVVDYLPVLTDLASAESADDVQSILEASATPIGGWRAKRTRWLASVGAIVGPDFSYEIAYDNAVQSTGLGVGLFAPVGIDIAFPIRPTRSSGGVFISAIDVGNLIDFRLTDSADENDGELSPEPEIGFVQLLAPGLFAKFGLGPSPFTFVLGGTWTPDARNFTPPGGATEKLDVFRVVASIAVDITMFPF